MAPNSAISQHLVKMAVLEACSRANVPHDSALAEQLQAEAAMSDGSAYVQTVNGQSLDRRIVELKGEAKFAAGLPSKAPTVRVTDDNQIRANFDRIARGEVTVDG